MKEERCVHYWSRGKVAMTPTHMTHGLRYEMATGEARVMKLLRRPWRLGYSFLARYVEERLSAAR